MYTTGYSNLTKFTQSSGNSFARPVTALTLIALPCLSAPSFTPNFTPNFTVDRSIPSTPQELLALRQAPIDTEIVAVAIAGVIQIARSQGQTLEDLMAELMREDALLDVQQRTWLSEVVASAWDSWP